MAELKDKIDDLKDSTKSLQGSGVERLNTSMQLLTEGFANFDTEKVSTGFKGIGAAMSAIPIILVIEGVKALIDNFDEVVKFAKEMTGGFSAAEREVSKLTKAFEAESIVNKTLIAQYDNQIALLTAQGASENELIAIKKKKINIEIVEAENQLRLNSAKAAQILLNDTLGDSLQKINIAILRNTGQTEAAEALEKAIFSDKKKRAKEELATAQEAAISLSKLKNDLLIIDAETNKKQVENAKKSAEEKIKIEQERQARDADIQNAEIDREEALKEKYLKIQKTAAENALRIAENLIAELKAIDDKKLQDDIAKAEVKLQNTYTQNDNYLQAQLELLSAEREQELSNTELTEYQRAEIINKYREQERQAQMKYYSDNLAGAANVTNSLGQLSDGLFDLKRSNLQKGTEEDKEAAKKQFEVNKAFSLASTAISGAQAVISASASVPYLYVGLAASVAATLATAGAMAKIASTKFQYFDGGFTSKGNPKQAAQSMGNAQFHNDEYVVPSKVKNKSEAIPHITALEKMRTGYKPSGISGFYDGGFTGRSASYSAASVAQTQNDLMNAVMSLPSPIVKVSEINKVTKSGEVSVNVSKL